MKNPPEEDEGKNMHIIFPFYQNTYAITKALKMTRLFIEEVEQTLCS